MLFEELAHKMLQGLNGQHWR